MNRQETIRQQLDSLSDSQLVEVALTAMTLSLKRHSDFLAHIAVVKITGEMARHEEDADDTPADIISREVAKTRFSDPRIDTLPLELANRMTDLAERLTAAARAREVNRDDMCSLVDDVKQFDADIQPLYAWHEEVRRELRRAVVSLN